MKVKQLMQEKVYTVGENDRIDRVFFLVHFEKVRHVPVLSKGQVVGIVSDRDLYKVVGPKSTGRSSPGHPEGIELRIMRRRVRHIMRRGVFTIDPEADAGEAASLMARRKIGGLPVVKGKQLVGIITATDLLKAFAKLSQLVNKLVTSV